MSITSLTYTPPIRKDAVGKLLDYELLEQAVERYGAGEALAATALVFRHLLPDQVIDLARPFAFAQGSSQVTVTIADGRCVLSVPMVRLPSGGASVAALRYVLTKVNGSGQLHQARLHGDDVYLEYAEQLHALHPHKLIEVLRRMPVEADRHDDWMESQFGVTPLARAPIAALDPDELARAYQIWQQHWTDVDALFQEALRKRSGWFLNEVTAFAVYRLRFALPLAGSLLPRLLEAAGTFNDGDVDPRKRETTLARFVKEMKAVGADELAKSLGHVDHAISPHIEGTAARLAGFLGPGNYMTSIEKYLASGHSMDAALALISTYYYLLATHSWPPEVATALKDGLAASSGKGWREAATFLVAHAASLVAAYDDDAAGGDAAAAGDEDDVADDAAEDDRDDVAERTTEETP